MNQRIEIDIPDEVLFSLKESKEEFSKNLRMAAAAKLFQIKKLSSGRAAQLAGITRLSFLQSLSKYGVPIIGLSKEELQEDIQNA